jgi:hypothetical protein
VVQAGFCLGRSRGSSPGHSHSPRRGPGRA